MSNLKEVLHKLKQHPLVQLAFNELGTKLPSRITYHSVIHTEEVLEEAIRFGLADELSDKDLELLAIAAAFHDLGFIERKDHNEVLGASMAKEAMTKYGRYSKDEVALVAQMILDTEVKFTNEGHKQVSSHKLSGYLLDADVANFGRDDFFEKAQLLLEELGTVYNKDFHIELLATLDCHRWNTKAAQGLREEKKQENMKKLMEMMQEMNSLI